MVVVAVAIGLSATAVVVVALWVAASVIVVVVTVGRVARLADVALVIVSSTVAAVVRAVRLAVDTPDARGLLLAIRAHILILWALPRPLLLRAQAEQLLPEPPPVLPLLALLIRDGERRLGRGHPRLRHAVVVPEAAVDDAAATELGAGRGVAERAPVGALAPQHGRLILLPVAFAPDEASVLGPEEEPDGAQYERGADDREEGHQARHVDVVGVDGALAGVEGLGGLGPCVERPEDLHGRECGASAQLEQVWRRWLVTAPVEKEGRALHAGDVPDCQQWGHPGPRSRARSSRRASNRTGHASSRIGLHDGRLGSEKKGM